MNNNWFVYRLADGLFTGEVQSAKKIDKVAIPEGCGRTQDASDWQSQRVDLASGAVINFQPPSPEPSEDFTWNADTRRWEATQDALTRQATARTAQAEIGALELASLRPLREMMLGVLDTRGAINRLEDIEEKIRELRASLKTQ
jgi:hypothetical protein